MRTATGLGLALAGVAGTTSLVCRPDSAADQSAASAVVAEVNRTFPAVPLHAAVEQGPAGAVASLRVRAPATADGPLEVALEARPGAALRQALLGASPSARGEAKGVAVYREVFAGTDLLRVVGPHAVEEFFLVRAPSGLKTLRYRLEATRAIVRFRLAGDRIEVLDAEGRSWLRSTPVYLVDARGHRHSCRVRLEPGDVLAIDVPQAASDYPLLVDPGWQATTSMATRRSEFAAALLTSGKVLACGGYNGTTTVATCELYDPTTGTWTAAKSMSAARGGPAVVLHNGTVLVVAGPNPPEIWNPASDTWSATAPMSVARSSATATVLPSGKILVAGGWAGGVAQASAEIYDPAANTWASGGTFTGGRRYHTATLLPSADKVLVAGGQDGNAPMASAALYDIAAGSWTAAAPMLVALYYHSATLLPSGNVIVVGGQRAADIGVLMYAYEPPTNTWYQGASLPAARAYHSGSLLPSGRILVAGGYRIGGYLADAVLYDTVTGFSPAGTMTTPHSSGQAAFVLASGRVLVVGGDDGTGATAKSELYDPSNPAWSGAASMPDARASPLVAQLPSGKVLVAGGDFTNAAAHLYDAATNSWGSAGTAGTGWGAAVPLHSGKVLVMGGYTTCSPTCVAKSTAAVYDPAGNSWAGVANMLTARGEFAAAQLPSGRILVCGGKNDAASPIVTAAAEVYDPTSDVWASIQGMSVPRNSHTATRLPSGKILVVGGGAGATSYATAEIYDPSTNLWTPAASMSVPRVVHSATLVPSGRVLVAGGSAPITGALASAELYDPTANTWSPAGSMTEARYLHGVALLASGEVLVVGGYSAGGVFLALLYSEWVDCGGSSGPRGRQGRFEGHLRPTQRCASSGRRVRVRSCDPIDLGVGISKGRARRGCWADPAHAPVRRPTRNT